MFFPRKQKEKKPNTAVKYEVREFIHGGIEYATDCPFGECGRYTHALHKVGAIECNLCRYQKKNNTEARVIRCTHPLLQESAVDKLFKK